ncbi:multiple sugar transport system permease protein [Desmospora activa DSM 45169]|uniref:Multiple sugar transport system permease protein n=1 Tax=Desmospora activa DSM 45169 TaxID=1121389 RepID=A0A2T4ZBW9_9BACL|nr:multiple sugar transport system permease protein [Desmospora activa DSM 45169]
MGRTPKKNKRIDKNRYGYYFLVPFAVIFIVFNLYPILYTFYLSMTSYDGLNKPEFVGLANYVTLARDPLFYQAFYNTVKIWIVGFIPQITMALIIAYTFTIAKVKGAALFKAVYYVPNLVTAATIGVLFSAILGFPNGLLNQLLLQWNLIDGPMNFLTMPHFTQNTIAAINWWMWFGNNMLICLAGMSAISNDYYEAAKIDGANLAKIFTSITLPLMKPILLYLMLTSFIGGLQLFDLAQVMTDGMGAPNNALNTLVLYLYNQGFVFNNFGYSSAIAYGMFMIILVFSCILFLLSYRKKVR